MSVERSATAGSDTATCTDEVFAALASPQRRAILRMLSEALVSADGSWCELGSGEVCACRFSERLGLSPSTVSHHMRQLRDAGLVSSRKQGLWVYYHLEREALDEAARAIKEL